MATNNILNTNRYPSGGHGQPNACAVDLVLTGAGGAAPTFAQGADNDNRHIASISRSAQGVYALTMAATGRVLLGCFLTPTTANAFYFLKSASLSSGVLTITVVDAAGATVDFVASDVVNVHVRFKA